MIIALLAFVTLMLFGFVKATGAICPKLGIIWCTNKDLLLIIFELILLLLLFTKNPVLFNKLVSTPVYSKIGVADITAIKNGENNAKGEEHSRGNKH